MNEKSELNSDMEYLKTEEELPEIADDAVEETAGWDAAEDSVRVYMKGIRVIPLLTPEEEQELVAGMFSSGLDQEEEKVRLQLLNDCVIRIRSHAIEKKMAETEDISLVLKLRKEKEETAGMRVFG